MKFYFDSSALIKRYVDEKGSDFVEGLFMEADTIAASSLCLPEVVSALARLQREKKLDPQRYRNCKRFAIEDFLAFEVCPLSPEVLNTSIHILERSDLRAADAIHIASAIRSKADRFVSGDVRQVEAAKRFRLAVNSV